MLTTKTFNPSCNYLDDLSFIEHLDETVDKNKRSLAHILMNMSWNVAKYTTPPLILLRMFGYGQYVDNPGYFFTEFGDRLVEYLIEQSAKTATVNKLVENSVAQGLKLALENRKFETIDGKDLSRSKFINFFDIIYILNYIIFFKYVEIVKKYRYLQILFLTMFYLVLTFFTIFINLENIFVRGKNVAKTRCTNLIIQDMKIMVMYYYLNRGPSPPA